MNYPHNPGSQPPATSQAAAPKPSEARRLRSLVLDCLHAYGAQTPDECAARLNLSILSIRPRFTELKRLEAIRETGERRPNLSGKAAAVFQIPQ